MFISMIMASLYYDTENEIIYLETVADRLLSELTMTLITVMMISSFYVYENKIPIIQLILLNLEDAAITEMEFRCHNFKLLHHN